MRRPRHDSAESSLSDQQLGARIRALRLERGLSLRALAAALGITPSALSQIELGKMRPSVTRLIEIISQLDVPLAAAFEQEPDNRAGADAAAAGDEITVSRADQAAVLTLGDGVRYRRLSPTAMPGFEVYESSYPPGSSSSQDGEFLRHSGHEMGSVLSGALTVEIGFERYELEAGDAITFPSTTPHRIRNLGETPAVAVWINMP